MSDVWIDTSGRPSMGDPQFVEGLVRKMLEEVRRFLWGLDDPNVNPRAEVPGLITRWAKAFDARNSEFVQTMSPQAQQVWLQNHGLGTEDSEQGAPVVCLLATTINQFVNACTKLEQGEIKHEQAQFWIEAAIEDCTCLLLGIENFAD